MEDVTPIGYTNWRNEQRPFGIKDVDRLRHIYCLGKSGVGKSTLLLNMAISDMQKGKGMAVLDPHGDLAEQLLDFVPKERVADVIYFNAADTDYPIGFNPLLNVNAEHAHLIASNLVSTFKKVWADSWGVRMEYILKFSLLTLLSNAATTLLDIQPLLTDTVYRNELLRQVRNPEIIAFWKNEYDKYSAAFRSEAISPVLNKTGVFRTNEPLRNIVGQQSSFSMQQVLAEGKILIANLSKGLIGEDSASILGSMLISAIQFAALARAKDNIIDRRPFFTYIDEAHSFLTLAMVDVLAEARKYGLSLFLTNQYLQQLDEDIVAGIFGNVGTLITFRIGAEDAKVLALEFFPVFCETDFTNLPKHEFYLRLMIDGVTSRPFSALSKDPPASSNSNKTSTIEHSGKSYTQHRSIVEKLLRIRAQNTASPQSNGTLFD